MQAKLKGQSDTQLEAVNKVVREAIITAAHEGFVMASETFDRVMNQIQEKWKEEFLNAAIKPTTVSKTMIEMAITSEVKYSYHTHTCCADEFAES